MGLQEQELLHLERQTGLPPLGRQMSLPFRGFEVRMWYLEMRFILNQHLELIVVGGRRRR